MNDTCVATIGSNLSELKQKIRDRMTVDLYFVATQIFGLSFFDADFHRDLATFYGRTDLYPRRIILAPRGSGKSTLRAVKQARNWLLNCDMRQLIVSYSSDQAQAFLKYIRESLILKSSICADLFPDHVAALKDDRKLRKDAWEFSQFNISGKRDPHFTAKGIDSGITGMHVDSLDVDDLIDEVNAYSTAECERAKRWVDISMNALEHQISTPWDFTGTRYHLLDPYHYLLESRPEFVPFIHPGLIVSHNEDGSITESSYWPSKFSVADLHQMQSTNSIQFAAQIQQNPLQSEDATFKESWLRYWEWDKTGQYIVKDNGQRVHKRNLTIAGVFDPALDGDSSRARNAVLFGAMDPNEDIILLSPWAKKGTPNQAIEAMLQAALRFEPDILAVETVLFQVLLLPALKQALKESAIAAYNITPVTPKGRSKPIRILATRSLFESRRVYIHRSHQDFYEEYITYPFGKTRDLLDAFAYLPELLYPPANTKVIDYDYGQLMAGEQNEGRDADTGY